jgi:hypothetical protein
MIVPCARAYVFRPEKRKAVRRAEAEPRSTGSSFIRPRALEGWGAMASPARRVNAAWTA